MTFAQALAWPSSAHAQQGSYAANPAVVAWIKDFSGRSNVDATWLQNTLGKAQKLERVQNFMRPPPEGSNDSTPNWEAYRTRFLQSSRISRGVQFWRDNQEALTRAERTYGVPAYVIAGIIGVETQYGKTLGNFRVLDSLTTLAFDFPSEHPRSDIRANYFLGELESFLQQCYSARCNPLAAHGSYAGATGLPQFMPSSIARYAVDFDGDGRIDLQNSASDAVGSVAHYLQVHNWQKDLRPWYPVAFAGDSANQLATLLAPSVLPTFSPDRMKELGAALPAEAARLPGPFAFIVLRNGDNAPPQFIAATQNFYAITRYNQSSFYVMAVLALGEAVQAQMQR